MSQEKSKKHLRHHRKKSPWPMITLIGGGLLLVVGLVFIFYKPGASKPAIEVTGAAAIKVDKEEVNLGDVKLGQTVTVSFQVSNVGDQPLRFSKAPYVEVKEGC